MKKVANQNQVNTRAPRSKFKISQRIAVSSEPSQTVTANSDVDAPFVDVRRQDRGIGAYSRMLDRELPKTAATAPLGRVASFFCGCGGIDLGLRSAGFELVFANDLYERACETFERNLGHAPDCADIREIEVSDVPDGIDVLTGGFPCVTFSTAGRRAGVVDDVNGKLYLEMCRVIAEVQPRYFVAENVRGLLNANGGAAVKLVLAAFLRLGYRTSWELVNMAEHGVPQTRQRVVFVGVRRDQWRGSFVFPKRTHRLRGDGKADRWLRCAVSLREAIGDLPDPSEEIVANMHGDAAAKMVRGTVNGFINSRPRRAAEPAHSQPTRANVVAVRRVVDHAPNNAPISVLHNMSKRVARLGDPSPISVSEAANVQPFIGGLRRMTVRECARVQSFPDWFEFCGTMSDGYKQVGNAVPPFYAKRLGLALLAYDRRMVVVDG